jgi:hypothetical protein
MPAAALTARVLSGLSATLPEVGLAHNAGSIPILSFTAAAIRCVQPR